MSHVTPLTREQIQRGVIERMVANRDPDLVPLTEEARQRSLDTMLARHPAGEDVWVFGYGSLTWNPAMEVTESRRARIHGYHRRLCLITRVARGTPERPGLMLGLDRGGSCQGVALRLPARRARDELAVLWRREMVDDAYRPCWVWAHGGGDRVPSIAFAMNRGHRRYAALMSDEQAARMVAAAQGQFGPCSEYLRTTVDHFAKLGIVDPALVRIAALVERYLAAGAAL
jgi:glutathione-specific gamma-glutamylcyclotransferase